MNQPATRQRRALQIAALLVAVTTCAILVRTFFNPSIRLDGYGYYAPLASLVFDGDVDLRNEFTHASAFMRKAYFLRPDGSAVDPFAVGAAVLWAPAVVATRAFDDEVRRRDPARPGATRAGSPGFRPRYLRAIAVTSALEALVGCVLLFVALRRWIGSSAGACGAVAATLGTPLVYYALAQPSYAHAASFLASAALVLAVVRDRERRVPWVVLGALWGFVALVRWQDAVLGLLLAPRMWHEISTHRAQPTRLARSLVLFLGAALVVFAPQLWFWNEIYGAPFVYTHAGFMQWSSPQVMAFLASTWHGAFVYSPVFLLGFIGIAFVPDRGLRFALWGAVLLEIYACAAAGDWWGGGGFSARRLTSVAPLAGVGVAWLVQRVRAADAARGARVLGWRTGVVVVLVGLATLWNLRMAHYNVRGLLPFNPDHPTDYIRHYRAGDVRRQKYGLWDYRRLAGEVAEAERRMWRP